MTTAHLVRFGAEEIPRDEFLLLLQEALELDTGPPQSWGNRDKEKLPDIPDREEDGESQ